MGWFKYSDNFGFCHKKCLDIGGLYVYDGAMYGPASQDKHDKLPVDAEFQYRALLLTTHLDCIEECACLIVSTSYINGSVYGLATNVHHLHTCVSGMDDQLSFDGLALCFIFDRMNIMIFI